MKAIFLKVKKDIMLINVLESECTRKIYYSHIKRIVRKFNSFSWLFEVELPRS